MDQLRDFTMQKLSAKLALPPVEFDNWLKDLGLLHRRRICQFCGATMTLRQPKDEKRYGTWRCQNKAQHPEGKTLEIGFLQGTFFAGSHLTTQKIFALTYYWAHQYGRQEDIKHELKIDDHTIVDWRMFCRDICAQHYVANPIMIGGEGRNKGVEMEIESYFVIGKVVEVDETLIVRRKYNRGRISEKEQIWLFGGVERGSQGKKCFMVPLELEEDQRRDAATLLPLIRQYVLPGTTVISDEWKAYGNPNPPPNRIPTGISAIRDPGNPNPLYTHQRINHSLNFVHPTMPLSTPILLNPNGKK